MTYYDCGHCGQPYVHGVRNGKGNFIFPARTLKGKPITNEQFYISLEIYGADTRTRLDICRSCIAKLLNEWEDLI